MTPRARVLAALNHREPDRVPIDCSGHRSSGIAALTYGKLREYLGLPSRPIRVYDPIQQLAIVEEDVLHRFGVDTIELGRAFFSKRAFWVYGLALMPAVIFFAHGIQQTFRRQSLAAIRPVSPVLLDSIREGETAEAVIQRVGQPVTDYSWERRRRINIQGAAGITTHKIDPPAEARFVRLNILIPSQNRDPSARIYEFEVYGENNAVNLALNRPATGSTPCTPDEGPEKAFNGSVTGGAKDRWSSRAGPRSA